MKRKNTTPKTLAVWLLVWVCPPTILLQAQSSEQTGAQWVIPPRDAALQHLNSVKDQSHLTFDVFTDISTAGNHSTLLGKNGRSGRREQRIQRFRSFDGDLLGQLLHPLFVFAPPYWAGLGRVLFCQWRDACRRRKSSSKRGQISRGSTRSLRSNAPEFLGARRKWRQSCGIFASCVGRNSCTGFPIPLFPDSSRKTAPEQAVLEIHRGQHRRLCYLRALACHHERPMLAGTCAPRARFCRIPVGRKRRTLRDGHDRRRRNHEQVHCAP